jgi:hypothetical protein
VHYFKVRFEAPGCGKVIDVYLDLRGRVVRPNIHCFRSKREYNRFAKERDLMVDIPQQW